MLRAGLFLCLVAVDVAAHLTVYAVEVAIDLLEVGAR